MNCYVVKDFACDLVNHNYQFGLSCARQNGTYVCSSKCGLRFGVFQLMKDNFYVRKNGNARDTLAAVVDLLSDT